MVRAKNIMETPTSAMPSRVMRERLQPSYNVKRIAPPAYHSSLGKLLYGLNPAKPWGQGCPGYVQEVGSPAPIVSSASS